MRYLAPSTIMVETTASMSYLSNNTWHDFHTSASAYPIDGLKLQTDPSKPYYLYYRTLNSGKTSFYPRVTSIENDYAGYPGKPIRLLDIEARSTDNGTNLQTGAVVVMYRVHTVGVGWFHG